MIDRVFVYWRRDLEYSANFYADGRSPDRDLTR